MNKLPLRTRKLETMTRLDRFSEPFPPTGAIDASATKRALGKPKADFWDVLFKEAVQNSWDARTGDKIDFDAYVRSFSSAEQQVLRDQVFRDASGVANSGLRAALNSNDMTVLILQDRDTRGLGGPTDASAAISETVKSDFRNFIFDIGRDARREVGGGTYGLGKGILYSASSVSTCLVYSQYRDSGGQLNSRFIAASVSEQHEEEGYRFTGRQWWGRVDLSNGAKRVEPVEGEPARGLAIQLGIDLPQDVTGTSIGILLPREAGTNSAAESKAGIADALVRAMKRWAWPHMVETDGSSTISFGVFEDGIGKEVSIDNDPDYQPFAEAYRAILARQAQADSAVPFTLSVERTPTDSERAQTGWLALKNIYVSEARPAMNNRVALMRGPRFIVDYKSVKPPEHGMPRVGVFVADSDTEVERIFAMSEPVTHDNWKREHGRSKSRPIAWTLDSIDEATGPKSKLQAPNSQGEGAVGVSKVSRLLGSSLIGLSGSGAELSPTPSPSRKKVGGGRAKRATAQVDGPPKFVNADSELVLVEFPISVAVAKGVDMSDLLVRPQVRVMTEAGEDSSPESEDVQIRGWFAAGNEVSTDAKGILLSDTIDGADLWLRVAHSRDVAVSVRVGIESKKVAE